MKSHQYLIILFFILGICLIVIGSIQYFKGSNIENIRQKQEEKVTTKTFENFNQDIALSNNSSGQQTEKWDTEENLLLNENKGFNTEIKTISKINSEISSEPDSKTIAINSNIVKEIDEMEDFSQAEQAEYKKNISLLTMRWNIVADRKEEVNKAIEELALMGDKVIEPIMKEFNKHGQTSSFRHQAIRVLEALRSPQARDILLEIALADNTFDNKAQKKWAARKYVSSLDNISDAKKLLSSTETGILNIAVIALKGQPIDKEILTRLIEILGLEIKGVSELNLCWNISYVMAEDPKSTYAGDKVSAIITALYSASTVPKANEKFQDHYYTYAEMTYNRYIDALSKIKGADSSLRNQTSRVSGKPLYSLIIARAHRGDSTVKSRLVDILEDKDADMFRAWAARCFADIGTPGDIPLLQKIADTDPLERKTHSPAPVPSKISYPVRNAATAAIKKIQDRYQ